MCVSECQTGALERVPLTVTNTLLSVILKLRPIQATIKLVTVNSGPARPVLPTSTVTFLFILNDPC